MSRVYFWVFAISLFSLHLKAQDHFYSTRNYTVIDGLPQSQVNCLLEDKSGYLWIGTHGGGLARFDGREFKVYSTIDGLLNNQIFDLHLDRHNILWMLHSRGITKFNGREFKQIAARDTKPPSNKFMWRMFNIQDTVFVLSARDRISKLHGDSIYYWEKPLPVELSRMHVGPQDEACFYLKDSTFLIRLPEETIAFKPDVKLNGVFNFFNYKKEIFFRTKDGVYRLNIHNRKVEKTSLAIDNQVLFYDDKEEALWTANATGLVREKLGTGARRDTLLHDVEVNQILRDSEGNTWIASNGNGLYKHFVRDYRRYASENIRGVMSVAKDREGSLWLGTMYKGVWKIEDGRETSFVDEAESFRNVINCVRVSPQNEVWVGSAFGLGHYDKIKNSFNWYLPKDGLAGGSIMTIEFTDEGMWIGTNNGLSFFDGKSFKNYSQKNGLTENRITNLYYSKHYKTLYIATATTLTSYKDGKFKILPLPELINTSILTIQPYKTSSLVLATTGGGVMVLDPSKNQRKLITARDGLPSDFIYFAGVDNKDYLWIGSEKGINRVKLDNNWEILENLHFNNDNGLTGVETNQNAFYLSPKEKYFGLIDGLYEFNHQVDINSTSFDLHLTDIQILYGEYSSRMYADSTYDFFRIPYRPEFPPDKNHLTFLFNRVDKQYSKSVKYKYLLENFDMKWSRPSSVNSVTYSNLPPGDYVFRVMVTNNKGSWANAGIEYPFTVKSPFYKTASFIAGVIIFMGGIITLIFYIRVKQRINRAVVMERIRQHEQEAVRKEIARDFHDEMGNQLTRIINYVSLLKLNGNGYINGNGRSNTDLYTKVEDSAKYLYSGTRDFIWSIDPVNDELSKLFLHIRDFGEKLFEEKGIHFRAFNEMKEPIKLPYGFSRQANLIFKEAMTNAFKYSEAQNVSLTLKRDEDDGFEMSLEDDGIGFCTDDIQKMNGLQNIRERADRISAALRIHSVKNQGTKIFLNFKITKKLKYGVAF
jgi:ligand-binding sensor domain-containing protein/signal transduction histidine kinase